MGAALGLEERAAQKRVARGLEKLRAFFAKRGVDSTAAIIAETISTNSVQQQLRDPSPVVPGSRFYRVQILQQ